MKVSVIIPFYSNFSWLDEAIQSVLNQTYTDYEIIVINDGSPEFDHDFLNRNKKNIIYFKTSNKGPAHARNFGISKSRGEYLAFLDSDDLWLPTKLEKQVALMERDNLIWSHTKYSIFQNVSESELRVFIDIDNSDFRGYVFPKCISILNIGTPCVMVRRDYLLKNNFIRFAENMRFGQDGYFWILMGISNNYLGFLNESLTLVRRSGNNAIHRARVHLYVRGKLFDNLIKLIEILYPKVHVQTITKFAYWYCSKVNYLLTFIFGNSKFDNFSSEILSRIMYFPAYLVFKNSNK